MVNKRIEIDEETEEMMKGYSVEERAEIIKNAFKEEEKPDKEEKEKPAEKTTTIKNTDIIVSTDTMINRFAEQQEECLAELIDKIEHPFKNIWEYYKWHRKAKMLELSGIASDTLYLDSRALFEELILPTEQQDTADKRATREIIVQIIHNDLVVTFANARQEFAARAEKHGESATT